MRHLKKVCLLGSENTVGRKYMASKVTSTDDKGKIEGSVWAFTYTFQLRNYCTIHIKEIIYILITNLMH